MNNLALSVLLLFSTLLTFSTVHGQSKSIDFELTTPADKVSKSLYRTIRILDSRQDTTNLGISANDKLLIIPKIPLSQQLQMSLDRLNDSTAESGELLLQIRRFRFSGDMRSLERGSCYLRLVLYAKTINGYRELGMLDTVLENHNGANRLSYMTSMAIADLLSKNLRKAPGAPAAGNRVPLSGYEEQTYSYYLLTRIDSVEKSNIKLYNITTFNEGVYMSYKTFKDQTPDYQILKVSYDTGQISAIRVIGKDGKGEKLKNSRIYGMVYLGIIYVSTQWGYFFIDKKDDEFSFVGKSRRSSTSGERAEGASQFGLTGLLSMASGDVVPYEMQIDHVNGSFIPMKKVK